MLVTEQQKGLSKKGQPAVIQAKNLATGLSELTDSDR